ncbi:MAG: hypothetical protein ABW136_00340 [Steroidobacteraceae bacterium]
MRQTFKFAVAALVLMLTPVGQAQTAPPCPKVGFAVVEPQATRETRPVTDGSRTIHVHRNLLTEAADIADIQLKNDRGDALLLIKFTPVAAKRLHEATTDRSGMRIAFLFGDTPLLSVVWEGSYGVPVTGSQLSINRGTEQARRMMAALNGCTAGTVRDDSR